MIVTMVTTSRDVYLAVNLSLIRSDPFVSPLVCLSVGVLVCLSVGLLVCLSVTYEENAPQSSSIKFPVRGPDCSWFIGDGAGTLDGIGVPPALNRGPGERVALE